MGKIYKRKLLLIIIYSVFIYYTFYIILKTSSSFSKSNKNVSEQDILDENFDFTDLKDTSDIINNEGIDIDLHNDLEHEDTEENVVDNDNNIDDNDNNMNDNSDHNIEEHINGDNTTEEDKTENDNIIEENNENDDNANNDQEEINNGNGDNDNNNNNGNNDSEKSKPNFKKYKTGLGYVLNYDGGEIEPEWDWVRNISIVYTWVDGSDVDFADVKAKYNGGVRASSSRDRSADELRYSLRSVEKYLPWHNGTIYILTSQQVPKWLDTSNPRIQMVYHKDIFPEHVYPTYDSATIEAFLDRIPGISERFIYFNDDVFLNNYVHPCFFFTRKTFYPKIYRRFPVELEKEEIDKIIEENNIHMIFTASKYYTRELAREYFDKKFEYRDLFHTPHVYYRDLMEPFRELFKEEFKEIFSNRFRNGRKFVTQYLFQVFMEYATQHKDFPLKLGGKGKAKNFVGKPLPENATIKKYSVKIVSGKIGDYLVKFGKITDSTRRNKRYFNYIRNHKSLLVYNFNDAYTKEEALYEFSEFMISQYPEPSSFEKKEYKELELPVAYKIVDINNYMKELVDDLKGTYSNKSLNQMKVMMKRHRMNIVKKYINEKNSLSGPVKEYSDREVEEMNFLRSYHGEDLSSEWEWAKRISLVYIANNSQEDLKNSLYEEELKFSLRSVDKYLPWHEGKIYLISQNKDHEGLSWVDKSNRRIEIIYYKDIIPNNSYPTLNKHVIEMYLDKIPNLSEKFVYLKCNHYFKNYTHPRFFFSKEFYPKYNFKDVIPVDKTLLEKHSDSSFVYTYKAIVRYFGESYINTFRHDENAPYPMYRDLFAPARKLFMAYVQKTNKHKDYNKMDILPIYMIQNYNIYGTAQPYYPDYVPGYGYVRDMPSPKLNPERTVEYYGFDITSQPIAESSILAKTYTTDSSENSKVRDDIENAYVNFFSLHIRNPDDLGRRDKYYLRGLWSKLYSEKSSFEH